MNITEKVAHLKGLIEGMELEDNKETKLIKAISEILEDVAYAISDAEDELGELGEEVEAIDEDLGRLEDDYYGEEDEDEDEDEDGCSCCCGGEDGMYEVKCPACGESICGDEDTINGGEMKCPNCGELLEFDLEDEDEGEDDKE
jgi:phage FluMu protein Com